MVFPSLMFQVDQGMVAQVSAWAVLVFSFLIYRFKKIMMTLFAVVGLFILFQAKGHAMAPVNYNYQSCMNYIYCANNLNYYGQSWGTQPSVYPYPQLPFQSMWPQQYYFTPHSPSPYQSNDCPFCNQMQMYQQQQSFPGFYQHPGGGAS